MPSPHQAAAHSERPPAGGHRIHQRHNIPSCFDAHSNRRKHYACQSAHYAGSNRQQGLPASRPHDGQETKERNKHRVRAQGDNAPCYRRLRQGHICRRDEIGRGLVPGGLFERGFRNVAHAVHMLQAVRHELARTSREKPCVKRRPCIEIRPWEPKPLFGPDFQIIPVGFGILRFRYAFHGVGDNRVIALCQRIAFQQSVDGIDLFLCHAVCMPNVRKRRLLHGDRQRLLFPSRNTAKHRNHLRHGQKHRKDGGCCRRTQAKHVRPRFRSREHRHRKRSRHNVYSEFFRKAHENADGDQTQEKRRLSQQSAPPDGKVDHHGEEQDVKP